jgi:hypothetical protein
MFLTLQFPLGDLRPFVEEPTGRLSCPHWLTPAIDKEFVRAVGVIRRRPKGGLIPWPGEGSYVDASRLVRFSTPLSEIDNQRAHQALRSFQPMFRRLFCNGEAVSRFELGLANSSRPNPKAVPVPALLDGLMTLPVRVPYDPAGAPRVKLETIRRPLVRAVQHATTAHGTNTDKMWVRPGAPMLLIEGAVREFSDWPWGMFTPTVVLELPRTAVLHSRSAEVWLIVSHRDGELDDRRKVRLHLLRLHAELEVLSVVLRATADGRVCTEREALAFARLESYLQRAAGFLKRGTVYGHDQPALLREVYRGFQLINEGQRESLLEALHQAKMSTRKSVEGVDEVFPLQ